MGVRGSFLKGHPFFCPALPDSLSVLVARVASSGVRGSPGVWRLVHRGGNLFSLSRRRLVWDYRGVDSFGFGGSGVNNVG